MKTLFLILMLIEPQQQLEQQIQRQIQLFEQLGAQLEQQRQQFDRMLKTMSEQRDQGKPVVVCSVEMRRVNGSDVRKVPLNASAVVPLNLFSTVSQPGGGCLPAEVRVTASYLDSNDNLVCSGTVENIASQTALSQSINLEIRPWNFREFARWRNEPPQTNSGPKRLVCINPDGTAEATSEEMERAASVLVNATIFPAGGGMSTTEIQLTLR
jgi:hypothetical protein